MTRVPSPPFAPIAGRDQGHLLVAPLLVMVVLWTIVPALVHTSPPLDVVESAMWGREWVVGTYKHPAMPAWVLEAGRYLNGGKIGWPAYFASQLFNLATLVITFLLARDLAGGRVATASVLVLLPVEYFSWRSVEFNHTIAQMPFWVGAVWCAWRAVERGQPVWWLALGTVAALGLYAKLSNAMLLVVIAGWIIASPRGRSSLKTAGPWMGAAVFALLCIPAVRWLTDYHFAPLDYASARARGQSLLSSFLSPLNAMLQAAPIFIALALAGVFRRGGVACEPMPIKSDTRRFLALVTLAPLVLAFVVALADRAGPRATWLAPALPLMATLVVLEFRSRLTDQVMRALRIVALGVVVILPVAYGVLLPRIGGSSASRPPMRQNWPQAEIARRLAAAWTAETNSPLKVVAGTDWMAGLVAINHPDRPSILTNGRLDRSPWIKPGQGALLVWADQHAARLSPEMKALAAGRPIKTITIPYRSDEPSNQLVVDYVVIPPG